MKMTLELAVGVAKTQAPGAALIAQAQVNAVTVLNIVSLDPFLSKVVLQFGSQAPRLGVR